MHETIHFWNPYEKTNDLTLFSENLEHVSIFDPCETFKVNGGHLENTIVCGISAKYYLGFYLTQCKVSQFLTFCTPPTRLF